MATEESTQVALTFSNKYFNGRVLVVKEALPKPTYTGGRSGNSGGRGGRGFGGGRSQRR